MDLITIATYSDSFEANFIKTKLNEAGIECFLQNETIANMTWLSSVAIGGIKLKVRPEDKEKSISLLNENTELNEDDEFIDSDPADSGVAACPACNSKAIIETVQPNFFAFIIGILTFSSTKTYNKKFYCHNCGHKWKE